MTGHRWRHSWDDPLQTGLVVVVHEATDAVGPVRDAFDPYAWIGVPPHVTVLYPFVPPELVSDAVVDEVTDVVRRFAPFDFELTHLAEFDGEVFYLAPRPIRPSRSPRSPRRCGSGSPTTRRSEGGSRRSCPI